MAPPLLYKAQTRRLFHAHIKLKLSAFWDESVFDELFALMETVNERYNSYAEGSFIDQINRQAGAFVETDATTVQLLNRLKDLSDDLAGEYDITVMPLIRLWGFYKTSAWRIPSDNEIRAALSQVGYRRIQIEGTKVAIEKGQEIITGSFVKAFAVDEVSKLMHATGITDAIINAGGSSICAINNDSHPYWQVEVNDTEWDGNTLFLLQLANQCYSTSSNENTFLEIAGKRYGHIISPKTGYPSENRQVGIISQDAFTGDVLSTGLFNCNKATFLRRMELLSDKYGVEGFLVDKDGDMVFSRNFEKYIIH
jgi:Membrane-associated lipoprotein involved in thiamine biosynthesis